MVSKKKDTGWWRAINTKLVSFQPDWVATFYYSFSVIAKLCSSPRTTNHHFLDAPPLLVLYFLLTVRFSARVPGVRCLVIAELVVDHIIPHSLLASSMGTNFFRGLVRLEMFGSQLNVSKTWLSCFWALSLCTLLNTRTLGWYYWELAVYNPARIPTSKWNGLICTTWTNTLPENLHWDVACWYRIVHGSTWDSCQTWAHLWKTSTQW